MDAETVLIVDSGLISGLGNNVEQTWSELVAGRTAMKPVRRFPVDAFDARLASINETLVYGEDDSLVWQMLRMLLAGRKTQIPHDTLVILATTVGEIDLLEQEVIQGTNPARSEPRYLLARIEELLGNTNPGNMIVSAACASSTIAVGRAAQLIRAGRAESVLVVACDAVTEFVFAGFSALGALDPDGPHPFDQGRAGLCLGDGAACALLASAPCARLHNWNGTTEILGWGAAVDAHHMTGPLPDGQGLVRAVQQAFAVAGLPPSDAGSMCAHGTATVQNDSAELAAIQAVFGNAAMPVYSIKGAIGHTLGAAGLIETLIAAYSLSQLHTPPTTGLRIPAEGAGGRISATPIPIARGKVALTVNSGFGGINAALVLRRLDS